MTAIKLVSISFKALLHFMGAGEMLFLRVQCV